MNKLKNERGSMTLYTVTTLVIVMVAVVSLTTLKINIMNAKELTDLLPVTPEEVINDFKVDIGNFKDLPLTEGTTLTNEYEEYRYTAVVTPTGKRTSEEIVETYDLVWNENNFYNDSPSPAHLLAYSSTANQQLRFTGNVISGYETIPNFIFETGANEGNYVGNSNTIVPVANATKARYRINEGEYNYIDGYPTTQSLSGLSLNLGDIVTIEYLDNANDLIAWGRYMRNNPYLSGVNLWLDVKMPNSPVMLNTKVNDHGDIIGTNLINTYETNNSIEFTYSRSPVCLTWRSYAYGYANYASYNNAQEKTPLNYLGSPCAVMDGGTMTMLNNGLTAVVTAKDRAWINGFNTVPTDTWFKIKTYWGNPPNKPAGYTVPTDQNIFDTKLYCSDPDVINEIVRQAQVSVDGYSSLWYTRVQNYFTALEDAYYAGEPYPPWSNYYPGVYDITSVAKVPCISGVKRDTLLSQYYKDLFNRSQIEINLLNNLTTDYKVTIESRVDIPRVDANLDLYYHVDGQPYELERQDYYISTDGGNKTNPVITVAQQLPKNYDYVDMSRITSNDTIKSEVKPMKFQILSDNVIIEKVTVEYEQLESAEYKIEIKDPTGQVIHEELVTIKNNY